MSKILIVEDDNDINGMINVALSKEGYECVSAYSGTEGLLRLEHEDYDLVILDLMLPGIEGNEVLKRTREKKNIPFIVLSAKDELDTKVELLTLGANDYMTKPFGVMELISRVKALLRRTKDVQVDTQIKYGDILVDNDKHAVTVCGNPCELTYKEYELLKYLSINKGIVLSRDKLMSQVWGFDYEGETRTVDAHIKTLRQKLGAAGACIKTIRNVGYMVE